MPLCVIGPAERYMPGTGWPRSSERNGKSQRTPRIRKFMDAGFDHIALSSMVGH